MANGYYNNDGTTLSRNSLARAAQVNAQLQAIAAGFDKLPTEAQLKQGAANVAANVGGTANAITLTMTYPISSYTDGMLLRFRGVSTNAAGGVTINVDGVGVVALKRQNGDDPVPGDIPAGGEIQIVYNASAGHFRLAGAQSGDVSAAEAARDAAVVAQGLSEDARDTSVAAAGDAEGFRDEAEGFRDQAAASAAGVNLPSINPGDAGKYLRAKQDETGFELVVIEDLPVVLPPSTVSPAPAEADVALYGLPVTFEGTPIYSLYGKPKAALQLQISASSDFTTPVYDSGEVAGSGVTYTLSDPASVLVPSTEYHWRLRYKDVDGDWSDWSTATTFTTASALSLSIGDAVGGGYYAGAIIDNGVTYGLIVAPKASGENGTLAYKNSNDGTITACITLTDGPGATAAMVSAGNSTVYPAAHFCNDLSIGGYTDWYLPARDELEIIYRNLKPDTSNNSTGDRTKSSYVYTNGGNSDDVSGDDHGVNRHSDPAGAAYTTGDPAQTGIAAFQGAGAEAFAAVIYWSSSEVSTTSAWDQGFDSGGQGSSNKTNNTRRVRAVRRFAL